jgi:hypothetical protein
MHPVENNKPKRGESMALTFPKYVIQYKANSSYCIGVQGEPGVNALVVLTTTNSPYTTWFMDPLTKLITLADDPSLALSIQGVEPGNQIPLCLLLKQDVTTGQAWNWGSDTPLILLSSNSGYCIDNENGNQQSGNTIQIYQIEPNDANQEWQISQIQ